MDKRIEYLGLTLAGLMTNIEFIEIFLKDKTIDSDKKVSMTLEMISQLKSRVRF